MSENVVTLWVTAAATDIKGLLIIFTRQRGVCGYSETFKVHFFGPFCICTNQGLWLESDFKAFIFNNLAPWRAVDEGVLRQTSIIWLERECEPLRAQIIYIVWFWLCDRGGFRDCIKNIHEFIHRFFFKSLGTPRFTTGVSGVPNVIQKYSCFYGLKSTFGHQPRLELIVWPFGKYAKSLLCRELDEKMVPVSCFPLYSEHTYVVLSVK